MHQLLEKMAAARPAAPSVGDRIGEWTYEELWERSRLVATRLAAAGVRSGDRVLFQAFSTRATAALLYGCSVANAVAVPVHPQIRPFQLDHVVRDADPALILVGDDEQAVNDPEWPWRAVRNTMTPAVGPGSRPVPAFLIYTSGSTAAPKGIVSPPSAVLFVVRSVGAVLGYTASDRIFCRIPLSFDYGLYQLLLAASAGAAVHMDDGRADAELVTEIATRSCTVVPVMPSLARMLVGLAGRREPASGIRLFTNTGEELPSAVIAGLRKHFPGARVQLMYGMSECKRISVLEPDGDLERPGSVGRPIPGTAVTVVDAGGRELPSGEIGEIIVRGPHVMAGYWGPAAADVHRFAGGRLHTGDYGRLDPSGYLYFEGRRDNIYKQNGLRASTSEIEAAVLEVPGVQQAVVLVPTRTRGAVLCFAGEADERDVLRGLADRLGRGKIPSACKVFDAFPTDFNGKVDRRELTALVDGRHR